MQIKRFEAQNMTEALRLIKKELGSEAVILSARSLKKESGIFGALKKNGVEITAATDHSFYPEKEKRTFEKRNFDTTENDRFDLKVSRYKDDESIISSLKSNLLFQDVDKKTAYKLNEELKKVLLSKGGIDEKIAMELLASNIEDMGARFSPIRVNQGNRKVIALIGSAGVGKTTTAAKLAAVWKYQEKKDVALIKLDDHRIGSMDQIKIYAKIVGVPVEIVSDKNGIKLALNKFKHKDLVIIDTPGLNCKNDVELEQMYHYFDNIKPVEIHLLFSATTKENDFIHLSEKLKKFEIRKLIFTKIDQSSTHGNILNHLIRTKIPASCFTFGHEIPESVEDATMERLLSLVLESRKKEKPATEFAETREIADNRVNRENDTKEYFVANQNSDVFHKPGCKWTRMIKENNVVVFNSVPEAEEKRFKPCRYCTPKAEMKYEYSKYDLRKRRVAS
ncbi:MAG: hypothetical protein HKO79_07370 [Desulfobacterales bacterium]|nr:hypothetical protein [Desulfobacterales bacterium]